MREHWFKTNNPFLPQRQCWRTVRESEEEVVVREAGDFQFDQECVETQNTQDCSDDDDGDDDNDRPTRVGRMQRRASCAATRRKKQVMTNACTQQTRNIG